MTAEAYAFPEIDGWRVEQKPPPGHAEEQNAIADAAQRGHDDGLAAGRALAEAELEPLRAVLAAAAASITAARDEVVAIAEVRAVELAVMLAQKILAAKLDADPHAILSLCEGALRRVVQKDDLVLEVNPADAELVRAEIAILESSAGGPDTISVSGERRVGRGGCVVRTREGEIDARIESQLERAADLMRRNLGVTPPPPE
jgi:flagellar biosynthesis/type III secretory pathway protein FliH